MKFRAVGSFLLRGDVLIHENTEGTTLALSSFLPATVFLISPGLKSLDHTFVSSFKLKNFSSSLLIACRVIDRKFKERDFVSITAAFLCAFWHKAMSCISFLIIRSVTELN